MRILFGKGSFPLQSTSLLRYSDTELKLPSHMQAIYDSLCRTSLYVLLKILDSKRLLIIYKREIISYPPNCLVIESWLVLVAFWRWSVASKLVLLSDIIEIRRIKVTGKSCIIEIPINKDKKVMDRYSTDEEEMILRSWFSFHGRDNDMITGSRTPSTPPDVMHISRSRLLTSAFFFEVCIYTVIL